MGWPSLSQQNITTVEDFSEQDEISIQAPVKRDTIVVRIDVRKEICQRRHLFITAAEAYKLFREEYPDEYIGKPKFVELRPKHVLLSSDQPVNVCTCRYHQNFMLLCEVMHKIHNDFLLYRHDLPPSLVCMKILMIAGITNVTNVKVENNSLKNSHCLIHLSK